LISINDFTNHHLYFFIVTSPQSARTEPAVNKKNNDHPCIHCLNKKSTGVINFFNDILCRTISSEIGLKGDFFDHAIKRISIFLQGWQNTYKGSRDFTTPNKNPGRMPAIAIRKTRFWQPAIRVCALEWGRI
jgi:hypothetical protein